MVLLRPYGLLFGIPNAHSLAPSPRKVHPPFVIFTTVRGTGYSRITTMNLVQDTVGFLRNRWWLVAIASSAVGIAAVSLRLSESEAAREKRIEESKKKELRAIGNRISHYAKSVRERFPDGAVVVSEEDLAAQLRKR